ncbi:GyrI-like domain-containing protein [Nocardia testacea]|uniref:GyrI-like domain-containing protein n=1 Tax=Nocardia testacea TaxID=248551 RepID=UPI0033E5ACB9
MAYEVALHESVPHTVLTIRRTLRSDRAGDDIRDGMTDLYRLVRSLGLLPVGPPATTYHGDFRSGAATEVELVLPVEAAGASDGEFTLRRTEPRCYASTCHYGDYAGIGAAYRALDDWLRHSGLQVTGPPTEIYRIAPDEAVTPADLLTEIRVPVISTTLSVRIPRPVTVVARAVREALRDCDFEILYELPVPAETSRRARPGTAEHLLLGAFDPGPRRRHGPVQRTDHPTAALRYHCATGEFEHCRRNCRSEAAHGMQWTAGTGAGGRASRGTAHRGTGSRGTRARVVPTTTRPAQHDRPVKSRSSSNVRPVPPTRERFGSVR